MSVVVARHAKSRSGAQSAQAAEARTVSRGPLPSRPKSMDESQ